ncbi:MAG: hypothetical protein IJQ52_05535, partial [Bacteroidales bacterium]|nr:hypothetical protein [Bacteroidales bacterium]
TEGAYPLELPWVGLRPPEGQPSSSGARGWWRREEKSFEDIFLSEKTFALFAKEIKKKVRQNRTFFEVYQGLITQPFLTDRES